MQFQAIWGDSNSDKFFVEADSTIRKIDGSGDHLVSLVAGTRASGYNGALAGAAYLSNRFSDFRYFDSQLFQ